jgi:carboxypeptidase D
MAELAELHTECGYADYIDKYLVFPPAGQQPALAGFNYTSNAKCDIFDKALTAVNDVNPCFNLYVPVKHPTWKADRQVRDCRPLSTAI